jgi:serine/threonine protein kinase
MPSPSVFGRYLLLDRIAFGGMAEVFRAKQFGEEGFDRIIAIKRVLPSVSDNEQFVAMFRDEAVITRTLQHGNIAQVYDFGKLDGSYYLAMEYVSGLDLKTYFSACEKNGMPMDPRVAALIVREVAQGLGYAHRATDSSGSSLGLVHRDVSPQNILLSWAGEIKLIDFGIAKARQKTQRTDAGVLKGKFGYMSPEQVRGLPLSNRSDIFSLGAVFWEILTGHRAFDHESDYATMDAVRAVDLPEFEQVAPMVPKALQMICLKALQKDEEERYSRAESLARDLGRWLSSQPEEIGQLELSNGLKDTFASDFGTERQLLSSYGHLSAEMMAQEIRGAGSSESMAEVQTGVSATNAINPNLTTPPPLIPPMQTPSVVHRQGLTPNLLKPAQKSRMPFLLMMLALVVTLAAGWEGWEYWNARPGSLRISAMPSVVQVFVNGELLGTTKPSPDGRGSIIIEGIVHGLVRIELAAKGHGTLSEMVEIRPSQVFAWQPNLPKVTLSDGTIELEVTPPDAHIVFGENEKVAVDGRMILTLKEGQKKDLVINANNFLPMRRTIGPLKPGSSETIKVQLIMERWNLQVLPEPSDALVSFYVSGKKLLKAKGAQKLRGLHPGAEILVRVNRRQCRGQKHRIISLGTGEQTLEVKLKCR